MADNPERLGEMASAISHALNHLAQVLTFLPLPIQLPHLTVGSTVDEFMDGMERTRTLIESEPADHAALGELDQAVLYILTAFDVLSIARLDEMRNWRYDAAIYACDMAIVHITLAHLVLTGEEEA
ncbi:hypothetical protein C1I98_13405 [Spongiactinospora gelatinilytica]|uniref:Uncharacterized protein n=1 Tax=Spongiactinospora gelatinilytica TaxID=2666298 RepID=A0A2W2GHX7_9ACTN|nr:hypothetical protein [Spongiactinospora gelatinilytica]PZG47462.1 hypothetical protein C1I98_13405 [Spongiactinospora gelatinilytica]